MKEICNCLKHGLWKMAWKLIKFEWRWRNYQPRINGGKNVGHGTGEKK